MEKSSLQRSSADALGTSEAVHTSDQCPENATSAQDNLDSDVQPPTMMISKIQAVELLVKLIQFVPKEFSKSSAVADESALSAKNAEIGDIRILSQFKLRYLCRRFRNIIHRETPLLLNCCDKGDSNFGLSISDRTSDIRISRDKTLDQLAELPRHAGFDSGFVSSSESSCGILPTIADGIYTSLVSSTFDEAGKYASIGAISRITHVFQQPLKLWVAVVSPGGNKISASNFLEQSLDIPLKQQFPSVSLARLCYNIPAPTDGALPEFRPSLRFFLEPSIDSLVYLHVNVFCLILPDDYVCASVVSLELNFRPLEDDYDYNDDGRRAAIFEVYAKLPRWFPNVRGISFWADRPQVDFTALNGFSGLTSVKLDSFTTESQANQDYRLASLTTVTTMYLACTDAFPSHISVLAPNLRTFTFSPFNDYAAALTNLRIELDSVKNSFEQLRFLTIKSTGGGFPSHSDFVLLLCSLARLPKLTSLELEFVFPLEQSQRFTWCPAGDLTISRALPPHLTSARLVFALRPGSVDYDYDSNVWSLKCIAAVPFVRESIYKDWLITLLHHVDEHPSLERFYCRCFAPSFDAIRALAEKWSKRSAAAIVELSLATVIHVQCTPLYARMNETRIPARGDRFRFRFTLTWRQSAKAKAIKRRAVTVDFQNP